MDREVKSRDKLCAVRDSRGDAITTVFMNAPNRYELYVLDEGEKPYVASHILPGGYSHLDPGWK